MHPLVLAAALLLCESHAFSPGARHLRAAAHALPVCAQQPPPRGGLGGLADEAMARIWRGMQVEAGQTELDPLPSERAKAAPIVVPDGPASTLPDSFEDAIGLAQSACAEALDSGSSRLVIEFDTSAGDETYGMLSRTNTFLQPFLPGFAASLPPPAEAEDGGVLPQLQVLFPDEGTSAYVKNNWQLSPGTVVGSMPRAKLVEGIDALLLVAPSATEVPAVQRLIAALDAEAPDTTLILVNPKLVDMQSTGYGLVGRELRNMVQASFLCCFALKSYPSGALFRLYPEGWSVWREDADAEGGYALAYNGVKRPSGDEVGDLLAGDDDADAEGGDFLGGLQQFIKGFQAM